MRNTTDCYTPTEYEPHTSRYDKMLRLMDMIEPQLLVHATEYTLGDDGTVTVLCANGTTLLVTEAAAELMMNVTNRKVWHMSDGHCVMCRIFTDPFGDGANGFHVDHIVPRSLHGIEHMSNYQPLCNVCNLAKGRNTLDYRTADQRAMYPAPTTPTAVIVEDRP